MFTERAAKKNIVTSKYINIIRSPLQSALGNISLLTARQHAENPQNTKQNKTAKRFLFPTCCENVHVHIYFTNYHVYCVRVLRIVLPNVYIYMYIDIYVRICVSIFIFPIPDRGQ